MKIKKIFQIITFLMLSYSTLNSLDFEDKWFLNEIYTGFIYKDHNSFLINNLILELNDHNIKEVTIVGDNLDFKIDYNKDGLAESIFKDGELYFDFSYEMQNEKVKIKFDRLDGYFTSEDIYDINENMLHKTEAYKLTKESRFDTTITEYTLRKSDKNYYFEETVLTMIFGKYSHSINDSYYTKYDSTLNLLEKGYKNIGLFDFIWDSYYPYLTVDYKSDTIETKFNANAFITCGFALDYRTFTTINLNNSTALIKYPKEEEFKDEIDEMVYFNNKNLPIKIIKYYTYKNIDSIMFDYKYYTD